jgi:hypothetical protein
MKARKLGLTAGVLVLSAFVAVFWSLPLAQSNGVACLDSPYEPGVFENLGSDEEPHRCGALIHCVDEGCTQIDPDCWKLTITRIATGECGLASCPPESRCRSCSGSIPCAVGDRFETAEKCEGGDPADKISSWVLPGGNCVETVQET